MKRVRIESIQFCLDALQDVGGADDRDRLRAADMVRSIAWSSPGSSTETPTEKEVCIRQIVNEAGRSEESSGIDIKVGCVAKQLYVADFPEYVFKKKQIYANGQVISANCWLESQRQYLERALASII